MNGNRYEVYDRYGIDYESTPGHLTLNDIGIESMIATELLTNLENHFKMTINLNEIKGITVKQLKEYNSGNSNELYTYLCSMKNLKKNISSCFSSPIETFVELNKIKIGRPIFIMPPIENKFDSYSKWIQTLNRPVYGINYVKNKMKFYDLNNLLDYYTHSIENFQTTGEYDIVGSFDSAPFIKKQVAEMKDVKGVILDIFNKDIYEKNNADNLFLELYLIYSLSDAPKQFLDQLKSKYQNEENLEKKIKILLNEMTIFSNNTILKTNFEESINVAVKRGQMLLKFTNEIILNKQDVDNLFPLYQKKLQIIKAIDLDMIENIEMNIKNSQKFYLLSNIEVNLNFLN